MTPTSDERREVAATMRVISSEGVKHLTLGEVLNSILTGGAPRPTTEMAILARLADLIDPMCRAVHQGTSMDDELVCSECGASLGVEVDDEQRFIPKFCSCCGARVVSGDD